MNMYIVMTILFVQLLPSSFAVAADETIKPGMAMSGIQDLMKPYGDGTPTLDMESDDPNNKLMMWPVDAGLIIVSYQIKHGTVDSIWYYISNGKPKSERFERELKVYAYNPKTGELKCGLSIK